MRGFSALRFVSVSCGIRGSMMRLRGGARKHNAAVARVLSIVSSHSRLSIGGPRPQSWAAEEWA
jgi:hypothetical protein